MAGLSARSISKFFKDEERGATLEVLKDISFDVHDGEFLSILGVSGCGKSTLLYIIGGHEQATNGNVTFTSVDGKRERHTNMVFQEPSLFPWRKTIDNVLFGPEVRGLSKKELRGEAEKYIQLVGLKGFEQKYPHQLSGGMKQRVAIARALMNDPEILLMDEPFASVDAQTRMLLQEQLIDIHQKTNKTTIFVTHNVEEAIFLSDRIIVLSARPATIKEIYPVEIQRPRTWSTRSQKEFTEIYGRILNSLREELKKSGAFTQLGTNNEAT